MIAFCRWIVYNDFVFLRIAITAPRAGGLLGAATLEGKGECNMENVTAFFGYFISYLILFAVFVALTVTACVTGIKWRKAKDAKAAPAENDH